jgi:hypothetical protein
MRLKKQCQALGFRTGGQVVFKLGDLPPAGALPPGAHEAILRAAQDITPLVADRPVLAEGEEFHSLEALFLHLSGERYATLGWL